MSDLEIHTPAPGPHQTTPPKARSGWQWKLLLAPLMGASVLLHIALLFLPLPALEVVEEATPEEEVPAAEEGPIDILSLSEIAASEPPPEAPPEQPKSRPEAAPPPAGAVPPPPDPSQIPETPVEAAPDEAAASNEFENEDEFEDEELPIEEETTSAANFDSTAATEQFVGDLSGLGVVDYTGDLGLPTPNLLRNPGNAACFLSPDGGPVPNARVTNWLDKEPQTLLRENLKDVYEPRGIVFNELPPYCGERYFQAVSADGNPFMTFSLVQLTGSTLLVVWASPPQ